MQTNYPLIFIVENDSSYNKLIASHLISDKFNRTESFFTWEECLKNLYKKPDIIILDYQMNGVNGMSGIDVLKESKKFNPKTEYVFLSEDDNFDLAINTIKYGAYDYVIKDQFAFKQLTGKINKIMRIQQLRLHNKRYKVGLTLLFITLALLIMSFVSFAINFPK